MNRGSPYRSVHGLVGGLASMRPRFMNRGSSEESARYIQADLASMRPRFMNRGSDIGDYATGVVLSRFNEAPIHESGK